MDLDEPFAHLLTQGMVIKDGAAMSKSRGNVVEPDDLVERYGADTARLFSLFASPPEKDLDWSDEGVEGSFRFLKRVWRLIHRWAPAFRELRPVQGVPENISPEARSLRKLTHRTVKKVTGDVADRFHFNTAISAVMELVNALYKFEPGKDPGDLAALHEAGRTLLLLLAPFAPHLAEELWEAVGEEGYISCQDWPGWSEELIAEDFITVVVQVNGKVRDHLEVEASAPEAVVVKAALARPKVEKHLKGLQLRKSIYVPGRLVSLVAR
jgi:leucyl-tRNA synthetase